MKLSKDLKARLRATASARQTRPSALVRQAIEKVMEDGGARPSLYDLAKDILDEPDTTGPRDLSTNPKYLRRYGR